jgi:chromate transporter
VVGVAARTAGGLLTPGTALQLCLLFGGASLMSIGGGNSVVPEIELQAVDMYHWLTRGQFADLFALAQAAPGPSILIVTLVGYSAAGVAGAVLATVAMVLPAAALVLAFARVWERVHMSPWRTAFEHGLAPIAVGLIAASGIIVARGADHTLAQYGLTALATVVFCTTKVQPLVVVALAGLAGWLGLV